MTNSNAKNKLYIVNIGIISCSVIEVKIVANIFYRCVDKQSDCIVDLDISQFAGKHLS